MTRAIVRRRILASGLYPELVSPVRPTPYGWTCLDGLCADEEAGRDADGCWTVHRSKTAAERCARSRYDHRVVPIDAATARAIRRGRGA